MVTHALAPKFNGAPSSFLGKAGTAAAKAQTPLRGIALIIASTIFFSGADVLTKVLSSSLPIVEIAWLRYMTFALLIIPVLLANGGLDTLSSHRPGLQVLRGLGTVGSALLFSTSLVFLPVADAPAINFVSPILITAL